MNIPAVSNTLQKERIKAVDLFCGVGGLTYGLQKAGINVTAGIDNDQTCQYAYEENCNAKFICGNICDFNYESISHYLGDARYKVMTGCAPCQPFSQHTVKMKKADKDTRWSLINEFLRIIVEGKPDVISTENVPQLKSKPIYARFKEVLREHDYQITDGILSCAHFGVPQSRRRLVLLASLHGEIPLPEGNSNNGKTVRAAIGHLAKLKHGTTNEHDCLHKCASLFPINLKRIKASKQGGSWKDWPKDLLPKCYTKLSGHSYADVYGRMSWDRPAPTLTTKFYGYGTGRYGHPQQHRALSLLEGAILQSFPDDYKFWPPNGKIHLATTGRHIGNAVPPALGNAIGQAIMKHIKEIDNGEQAKI